MPDPALRKPPATPAVPLPPAGTLADLVLVRLLRAKASMTPKKLRDDIASLFRRPPSAEQAGEAIAALRAAGLVTPKGQQLTDAGRARALAYLGVTEFPPRTNWGTVKAKYLVPKALGLSPTSADDAKLVGDAGKLAAFLLKRKLDLPVGTPHSLGGVFEALACRFLGFPDHVSLKTVVPAVISREMKYDPPLTSADLPKVGPRLLLGATRSGVEGLRTVALAALATAEATPPADSSEPFDLEAFANTVQAVAHTSPTGRFGDNKVFISHLWRQLQDQPQIAPLGLDGFKQRLVEANRENLLTLSRADLVQVMDPADVRESETAYLNAVFHFVLVEKE